MTLDPGESVRLDLVPVRSSDLRLRGGRRLDAGDSVHLPALAGCKLSGAPAISQLGASNSCAGYARWQSAFFLDPPVGHRWAVGDRSARAPIRRQSMTFPSVWVPCMPSGAPAVLLWDNMAMLGVSLTLTDVRVERHIVRFKTPRLTRLLRPEPQGPHKGDNSQT